MTLGPICHVVPTFNTGSGGPAYSVSSLIQQLTLKGCPAQLVSLDYKDAGSLAPADGADTYIFEANWLTQATRGIHPKMKHCLTQLASSSSQLIHSHGLWMRPNFYARTAAVAHNLPLVISPRGMLEPWSLQNGRVKKWLAWLAFEKKNLASARIIHATSEPEYESIRRCGFCQPVCVIPNGIDLARVETNVDRAQLEASHPILADKKWLLFMSRLHPKKGIIELLQSWSRLAEQFPDWILIIAGPDLTNYQDNLRTFLESPDLQKRIVFTGMLSGSMKQCALTHASLFVLPSYSENFGNVILEALAYETPVITTKATPWGSLVEHQCGWWIDINQLSLEQTLREALPLSARDLAEMGARGKKMISEKFQWSSIAEEFINVYSWLINSGPCPASIIFE